MQSISSSLRQCFERGERKSAKITLKNYQYDELIITEADIVSNTFSIDRYCITGNKIEIGTTISAELSLDLDNGGGRFDEVTFEGAELFVEIGIADVNDSYVPCGKFTVDEPPRNKRRISLKALDFMMLFDNTADVRNLSFDTPESLVEGICQKCDVVLSSKVDFKDFANYTQKLVTPTTEVTYRQLLQWVCQILGVCAYFDGNGELMFSWYTDAKDTSGNKITIDTSVRYSGDAYENDIAVTGVVIKAGDKDFKAGTTANALVIENNQLLDSAGADLGTVANNIWNKVNGFKYRPYECSCLPMPYIFPLDKIVYKDQNSNEIATVVTHHNFGLNRASALAAKGETEQQRNYARSRGVTKDEINAAIAEAMKGVNLTTDHFHVKYSPYPAGRNPDTNAVSWSDEPDADSVYIGTCVTDSSSEPDSPEDYNWIKIKGEDGGTLQVKYKSSSTKPTIFNNNVDGWVDTMPTPSAGQRVYMTQKLSTETNWSTPIQISAEDGTTPTITITSDGYWKINDDKTTVKAEGTPGKTPTITVGENGNWLVDGTDTGTKAQGAQGKDGANIEYIYYRKTASGTPTTPTASTVIHTPTSTTYDKWTSSPCGITETYKYEYVSVRTKAAGSSTWGAFSTPVIWSKWGEKGTDGDGIEYKYYLSNSSTKPTYSASSTSWKDDPTGVSASNMYEYVVQITHHGDGTTSTSAVSLWAKWGEKGTNGRTVVSITTQYYRSTSNTTQTGGSWSTDIPEWVENTYLWQREVTVFDNPSETKYGTPILDKSWDALGAAVGGYSVLTQATEDLNAALAGSLGLNKTVHTDGCTYYHSASTLTGSKNGDTIFKLSSAGFGVSTNGWQGTSDTFYNFGITATGDAVWKTLTAHKISADLIEAGEIKSVSNAALETSYDLNSGLLTMKSVGGKESFGFGVNNNNHLMLQYNYSDSSKLGVVVGFYNNGSIYKDYARTQAYTPSMNYYYIDALTYKVYKWDGAKFIVLSNTNSEIQTVLESQKGFALHAKGKTAGYTIGNNGVVTSDFNATQANIYGFDTTADSLVNVTKKTPVFKFYDATQESSGEVSHLTAIRKNSIVTTYMGAENYAIPVSGTLFDLGKLIEGIVEQIQGVVLYDATGTENNATNRNADVELNQSVTDFSYIEIYFEDSNGDNGGCTKVYRPYAKDIMLSINEPASNVIYIRSTIVTVYTEKITIDTSKSNCISMTSDGGIKKVAGNQIFITRVVGYKDHNIIAQPHTCNSFVSKVTSKVLPTCTEAGYEITTYSCSICGKVQRTEETTLNATDHIDLDNDGKCDNCGSSDITHYHKYTSVVTPPTATAQGYTTYTCNCGYSYKGNYTNPTGCSHSSTAVRYETTKNATCTTAGSRNKITYCTSCNAVISSVAETIPTTAHNYVNGTCSVCGATSGGGTSGGTTTIKLTTSGASSTDVAYINSQGTTEVNLTTGASYTVAAASPNGTISKVELYMDGVYSGVVSTSSNTTTDGKGFQYSTTVFAASAGKTLEYRVYFTGSSSGSGTGEEITIKVGANDSSLGTYSVKVNGITANPISDDGIDSSYLVKVGDALTLQATLTGGSKFYYWGDMGNSGAKITDENPWTFTFDGSITRYRAMFI